MDNQNENICPTVRFQYKQAPIPAYWCLQPNTACINDNYNLIDLIEGSEEYDLIKADFMRTMNFGYINPKVFHVIYYVTLFKRISLITSHFLNDYNTGWFFFFFTDFNVKLTFVL